jgi:hypothetical protein
MVNQLCRYGYVAKEENALIDIRWGWVYTDQMGILMKYRKTTKYEKQPPLLMLAIEFVVK